MKDHEKRIRDFLSERSHMRGLCPEQITGANDNHLNVSDLRALLADLDEMRAALRHADRSLNNWIALHPDNKDALDTIALEAIDAVLKGASHE